MDTVVNYFLLLIVFVFDPLAICLVIAANFAFLRYTGDVEDSRSFSSWLGFLSKRYYIKKKQV